MSGPFVFSRRRFLQTTGGISALSLAGSMDKLGLSSAAAQSGGYKALVCMFLFGGNDSNNMVMPFTNYAQYLAARPVSSGINLPQASLLQITPTNAGGAVYGLHPAMPELQNLFNVGKCAILCNVGSLSAPITRAQYISSKHGGIQVPDKLFSHSDQQQRVHDDDRQCLAGQGHGVGRPAGRQGGRVECGQRDADVDVVLGLADVRQWRQRALALAADRRQLRLLGRRRRARPRSHAQRRAPRSCSFPTRTRS